MKEQDLESDYDSETDEEDETKEELQPKKSPYEVSIQKTNKDGLEQARCCELGILPKLPAGFALIGRSGSGKTQLAVHMLTSPYLLGGYFQYIHLFSGVKPDPELIESLKIPKDCLHCPFEEQDVQTICDRMEKVVEKQGFKKTPKVCLVFDDFLNKEKFIRSPTMTKLCTANRHMNISYILLSQYYRRLRPVIRTNVSYLAIFPSSMVELVKVAEEQCPPCMSKPAFIQKTQEATSQKYSFLGINTKANGCEMLRKGFNEII